jgi:hypothetical protein
MFGLISACAFAACVPTITAKKLKLPIRARFMIFLPLDNEGEARNTRHHEVNFPEHAR